MILDILILLALGSAAWIGFRNGIIHTAVMFLGFMAGALLALKFSGTASHFLRSHFELNGLFLPFISFAFIFAMVTAAMWLLGKALTKAASFTPAGILNKIGGSLLWSGTMLILVCLMLWMVDQSGILPPEEKVKSRSFPVIEKLSPLLIEKTGKMIPFIGSIYKSLEDYFNTIPAGKQG